MKNLEDVKILVVGDIMLDNYIIGVAERLSPEAAVPIVRVLDSFHQLGGAGNTIHNIRSLGCEVICVAAVGADSPGRVIEQLLRDMDVRAMLYISSAIKTTIKNRVIEKRFQTQLLRFDSETVRPLPEIKQLIIGNDSFKDIDIIVVSDYGKGVITRQTMEALREYNIPIIVDPKPINAILYGDVFMVTPNKKEYADMFLAEVEYILETLGQDGINIRNGKHKLLEHIPGDPVKVYSVSGAGDTVVATMAICLARGMSVSNSAEVANKCGHYVVTQPVTSTVPKELFEEIIEVYQ